MAGRNKKPEEEKKYRVIVFIEKKIIDKLGMKQCEDVSRISMNEEFKKQSKPWN